MQGVMAHVAAPSPLCRAARRGAPPRAAAPRGCRARDAPPCRARGGDFGGAGGGPGPGGGPNDDDDDDDLDGFELEEEGDASVRLFLDSADVKAWEAWLPTGLFFGCTTNPAILRRDGVPCTSGGLRTLTRHAFDLGAEELHLQAWGRGWAEMYACALDLYELDARVVVKLPATRDGLRAARRLGADGVPFTLTALYARHQAVAALAARAAYAAPYLGRMADAGRDALADVAAMQAIVDASTSYDGECRLLVASLRSVDEIAALAGEGCNTFAVPVGLAAALADEPLTIAAADEFQRAAEENGAPPPRAG